MPSISSLEGPTWVEAAAVDDEAVAVDDELAAGAELECAGASARRTLVVAGARDRFTPAHRGERLARGLPDAELELLPDATHFGLLEHPEAIGRRVERFLAERLGLGAGDRA